MEFVGCAEQFSVRTEHGEGIVEARQRAFLGNADFAREKHARIAGDLRDVRDGLRVPLQ